MNKEIKKWTKAGVLFTIIIGSLLHFVYAWSGKNTIVGIISPINESTWEHLKMLFWPTLLFSIIEFFLIGKHYKNYLTGRAVGIYVGILMIVTLFYTYTGVIGTHYTAIDILIFIVSVIISYYVGYKITISRNKVNGFANFLALISIALLFFAFVYFTNNAPQIPLFRDPSAG